MTQPAAPEQTYTLTYEPETSPDEPWVVRGEPSGCTFLFATKLEALAVFGKLIKPTGKEKA